MNPDPLDDLWRQRLADLSQSGLSVRQWCEQKGVTKSTYGYWRRKLALADAAETGGTDWLCVTSDPPVPTVSKGLTVEIAGASIPVQNGFDPALLRAIVVALGEPRC